MLSLGNDGYKEALSEYKLSTNQKYVNMVREVGGNITAAVEKYLREHNQSNLIAGYKWEFNVLVSKEMNAWCMPGGKIAFYEGIMPICADANGVAVVMSHEIAHAVANHGNERLSQQLAVQMGGVALSVALAKEPETTRNLAMGAFGAGSALGVLLPYSRKHESEADELGLYFMAMAGYNPVHAVNFWQRMKAMSQGNPPEFLSTHPATQTRINNLNSKMNKALVYYNQSQKK
jgi:predicted Zn-dependent protease